MTLWSALSSWYRSLCSRGKVCTPRQNSFNSDCTLTLSRSERLTRTLTKLQCPWPGNWLPPPFFLPPKAPSSDHKRRLTTFTPQTHTPASHPPDNRESKRHKRGGVGQFGEGEGAGGFGGSHICHQKPQLVRGSWWGNEWAFHRGGIVTAGVFSWWGKRLLCSQIRRRTSAGKFKHHNSHI